MARVEAAPDHDFVSGVLWAEVVHALARLAIRPEALVLTVVARYDYDYLYWDVRLEGRLRGTSMTWEVQDCVGFHSHKERQIGVTRLAGRLHDCFFAPYLNDCAA